MKQKILVAAGLLCLGTSPAFAFTIPAMAPDMAKAVKDVWSDQMAAEQASLFDTGEAWMGETKTPSALSAGADWFDKGLADTSADMPAKIALASDSGFDAAAKADGDLADAGPSEAVMQATPVAAAAAYPPCHRGAGDDHCIQLYEPGVRAQLAQWNNETSGSQTAMGGPYEPVDSSLAGELGGPSRAASGNGVGDGAAGQVSDTAAPAGAQYTGVGGPLEERDYPACSRTITDSCIQLYERGVRR